MKTIFETCKPRKPEEIAYELIDEKLTAAIWTIQDSEGKTCHAV